MLLEFLGQVLDLRSRGRVVRVPDPVADGAVGLWFAGFGGLTGEAGDVLAVAVYLGVADLVDGLDEVLLILWDVEVAAVPAAGAAVDA